MTNPLSLAGNRSAMVPPTIELPTDEDMPCYRSVRSIPLALGYTYKPPNDE